MHPWAASGYDDTVQFVFFYCFSDFFLSRVSAGVSVFFNVDYVGYGFCVLGDCRYVHGTCDVHAAVADENADPQFFWFLGFGLLWGFCFAHFTISSLS
jgi:hypothetical protein